ncbi:hypothetical protein [Streptomyces sp. NPDC005408]|uniref:hypothetical protein n=1 Tax=Streptomyces sp. NPDC005408 TaxID=3155341 RepID=UPI0033A662BA
MTDATKYSAPDASSTEFEISFRDDATEADRKNAELSVAALVARSVASVAQDRAEEADLAEMTDSVNGPFLKLIEEDPLAVKALDKLRTHELMRPDAMETLRRDALPNLTYDAMPPVPQRAANLRSLGFVPPYDFSWAWHDGNGNAPFSILIDRPSGNLGLDARSGALPGGASGFVNAHAGFGVFLRSDTPGQRFPHAVLNPGRWSNVLKTVGIGSNATSEGGFELTVFEDGRLLAAASRKLWRTRIGAGESASGGEGWHLITGPELEFTIQPGRGYTFNAGVWVFSDRSTGIGAAAVQSLLQGIVTRMWVFG